MNLTFHIIRKDLRALRWGLLLWVAACLTHLGLRLTQLSRGDFASMAPFWLRLEKSTRWDYLLVCVLPLLLIPPLFHLDSLRGRLAFWKTLPIGRWRMLTAKLATLLTFFVVLPLLCELVYVWRAQLGSVLPHALEGWAARFLPGVAAVTLGCFLARSLVTGIPGVALALWAAVGLLYWPFGGPVHKAAVRAAAKPAPEGVKASVDAAHFRFKRTFRGVPPEPNQPQQTEERLAIEMPITVRDLPFGILVDSFSLQFSNLMVNGRNLAITPEARRNNTHYAGVTGLPAQEARDQMENSFTWENPQVWTVSTDYFKVATKDLPQTGVPVEGKVRVALVQRIPVARLPLADGAAWQAGLHRLTLSELSPPDAMKVRGTATLSTVLADPRGKTGGLDLSQSYYLWAEHLTLPYRTPLQHLPVEAWQNPTPWFSKPPAITRAKRKLESGWDRGTVDVTRSRKRMVLRWEFTPTDLLGRQTTPIAVARFAEEQAQARNWRVSLVRYEPAGIIEIPFKTVMARPAPPEDEPDETTLPAPKSAKPLEAALAEIRLPAHPTHEEARAAFAKILAAARSVLGTHERNEEKIRSNEEELRRHEDALLQKLASLGPENIDVLLAAATDELRRADNRRTAEAVRYGGWRFHEAKVSYFWGCVLRVAGDLARPEDKAVFLKYHSPLVDLLSTLETMGWRDEALPAMRATAKNTPVPHSWQDAFAHQPGDAALYAQIRQCALSPDRIAQLIQRRVLPAHEAASYAWEKTVASIPNPSLIMPIFQLAMGYGVAIIPRDLQRILRLTDQQMYWRYGTTRAVQAGYTQIFSLRSDCPPTVAAATAWLEQNATQLAFNQTTGRYELPGAATAVPDISAWGKFRDPMFNGKLALADGAITLTTTAAHYGIPSWATPKLEREFEGDFTCEVEVSPTFNLAPSWDGDEVPHQSAGLLAEIDGNRFLRWEHGLFKNVDGYQLREEIARNGSSSVAQRRVDAWDPLRPTTLRLSRHGIVVMTAWRQGQDEWQETDREELPTWTGKMRVSCFVMNNTIRPFGARFSNLHAVPQSAPPLVAIPHPKLPEGVAPTLSGTDFGTWGKFESPVNPAAAKLEGHTLSITVAPEGGDFYLPHRVDAPRVLTEVEGDFTLEATIAPTGKKEWHGADLLLLANSENFVRVGLGIGSGDKPRITRERADGGRSVATPGLPGTLDFTKPVHFRLQRQGRLLTTDYQQEGGEWITSYPLNIQNWPKKLQAGVVAINTSKEPFTAIFSDFLLTKTIEPKP